MNEDDVNEPQRPAERGIHTKRRSATAAAKSATDTLLKGGLTAVATAIGGPLAGIGVSTLASALGGFIESQADERAASVFIHAAKQIRQRIEAGEPLRSDGFFDAQGDDRSAAEQTMETVLRTCRDEAFERKLPYMSNMLCEIAFDASVDLDMAHQTISTAESLTYRQLCIMHLAVSKDDYPLRTDDYRGQGTFSADLFPVLQECADLYQSGLFNFGGEVVFGLTDVKPSAMQLQGVGAVLHRLMRLHEVPHGDIARIAHLLSTG